MELWFLITVTICIVFILKSFLSLFTTTTTKPQRPLPPGPSQIPIISMLSWLTKSTNEIESLLRSLGSKFGPILTVQIGSRPAIFILDRSIAHKALVQNGPLFANRMKAPPTAKIISCNQHSINSASYGSTWRLLRRNLASEIMNQSRIKSYSHARNWVLDVLINRLQDDEGSSGSVKVIDHFRYAMFCLLLFLCFGEKFEDEKQIREIEDAHHRLLFSFVRFQILNFCPSITKILLRSRWNELYDIVDNRRNLLLPLIRARKQELLTTSTNHEEDDDDHRVLAYVDTLLRLELEEEDEQEEQDNNNSTRTRGTKRKLTEAEIACLCSEFLDAGTGTTSTTLQWIMANLVKYPEIQDKLVEEIKGMVLRGSTEDDHDQYAAQQAKVKEEDLAKMNYLKAIILETLRLHPPGHFLLPHAVTPPTRTNEVIELNGYTIPKNASINVLLVDLGRDPEVWEDPMKFKPERFLKSSSSTKELDPEFDITGTREIKMMPFGVGRRICPGSSLAMLHLEYFVANLVWKFHWSAVDAEVDMSEDQQFTIVMKNPLRARIAPRFK